MGGRSVGAAGSELARLMTYGADGAASDGELLRRFAASRGEEAQAAFAAIVGRHGAMVLGVCRRVAGDAADAEDAFQATFLVLARKARSLRRGELLANWLYGVAVRTSRKLKAQANRRRSKEGSMDGQATRPEAAVPAPDAARDEILQALDDELSRLPDRLRRAVVLCDLQSMSHREAARLLGLPVGTVSSRLVRAREALRSRLVRRGFTLSAAGLAAILESEAAAGAVPPALADATCRAAAAGLLGAGAAGAASSAAVDLSRQVLKSVWISALPSRILAAGVLIAAMIGAGVVASQLAGTGDPSPFDRAVPDDWSWVDDLPGLDAATRERFKRCARSANENFANLHRLTCDFDLDVENFRNDGANHLTFEPGHLRGKLYWNEGAVRYDFEGLDPRHRNSRGEWQAGSSGTFSVLRTRDMAARTEEHEVFGVMLKIEPPPKSLAEWRGGFPFRDLDPWVHYATCFRAAPGELKAMMKSMRGTSKEDERFIHLRLDHAGEGHWIEITCDKSAADLPVKVRFGEVRKGEVMTHGEETCEWTNTDGAWCPSHLVKVAIMGLERHPSRQFDLRTSNLRANRSAPIPAAVFTPGDMPLPEGYGGLDLRKQPPINLIRAGGVVRERRPGEPTKSAGSGPIPFPKPGSVDDGVSREPYLALVAASRKRRRAADEAVMKAKGEAQQAAAIERLSKVQAEDTARFLDLAGTHAGDRLAFEALEEVAVAPSAPKESLRAAEFLIRDHRNDPGMRKVYAELDAPLFASSPAADRLLRDGLVNAPDRESRARAGLSLARNLRWKARTLRKLSSRWADPYLALSTKATAGDAFDALRSESPDAADAQAEQLYQRLVDEFTDVRIGDATIGDEARRELFQLRDLAIGKPAPEVEGPDADGRPMKLSDFRGKVVVLTFNAGWAHDGKYPLEHELLDRLKGRPSVLLMMDVDGEESALRKALADGEITWPCWWEGRETGPNRTLWRANEIPSVFVIDANGIIRGKELEGRDLAEAVEALLPRQ
ncbi:ECF RNA polymerase sigma factor SigE [Aquisphaera giovannonii]|uniref:ECF RNA polymerase sigma factor SigE n=1 Tax=Aquisphaera giovannonii TaxID=406548 RepID=A0A5B9W5R3_9BACT|nr:sigma-70 family RNA polymerase sigma factor [Aquisphaera giovannonii]QEH35943.1 ECF RNA polymerase sigma factor SigE [Aquisphaera giovannonii]